MADSRLDESGEARIAESGALGTGADSGGDFEGNPGENPPDLVEHLRHPRWKRRVVLATGLVALIAAAVVLPPLINVSRYQRQVTALISQSLGRPVRLSSVGLRLLPRPGFVLHNLTVSEDPAFGVEPILSAQTVVAAVDIFSLWSGKPRIDRISVDEASLNLVRSGDGRWNLESLMLGARPVLTGGPGTGSASAMGQRNAGKPVKLPYLEATASRVNLKNGVEKTPFSVTNTDFSLWQDEPGEWRVRLRGQPVRTDMEMSLADTGEVRMEATLRSAQVLDQMPLRLQAEWRDAQLGQLSRLLLGSDAGWRGEVRANVDIQGTMGAAQTTARLRATGVRREEFTPESPLDFDANCKLLYQHSKNAIHDLGCDTAVGDGRLHLKAELPAVSGGNEAMLEVRQIPLQAGLDLLRTVRRGFAPGIVARGTVNGSLGYKEAAAAPVVTGSLRGRAASGRSQGSSNGPFSGSLTVDGASLHGGGLKDAIVLPRMVWAPEAGGGTGSGTVRKATAGKSSGARAVAPVSNLWELSTRFTVALGTVSIPGLPVSAAPVSSHQAGMGSSGAASADRTEADAVSGKVKIDPNQSSQEKSVQAEAGQAEMGQTGSEDREKEPGGAKALPAGKPAPAASSAATSLAQTATVRLTLSPKGYWGAAAGTAGVARIRELAYAFGLGHQEALDGVTAGATEFAVTASGPWLPGFEAVPEAAPEADEAKSPAAVVASGKDEAVPTNGISDREILQGQFELRRIQWKPGYLVQPVELQSGSVTLDGGRISVSGAFGYGVLRGTMRGLARAGYENCRTAECEPLVELQFGALDAGVVQGALLGPPEQKTLLSPLMDRMRSPERAKLPAARMNVLVDSLVVGPETLRKVALGLALSSEEVKLESWSAGVLGGTANGTGSFRWSGDRPEYAFEGKFTGVNGAQLGALLGGRWSGESVSGSGKVRLAGLTVKDLAASAAGDVRFDWGRGSIAAGGQAIRFDKWTGAAAIQGGRVQLGENALITGKKSVSVSGMAPFGEQAKLMVSGKTSAKASAGK